MTTAPTRGAREGPPTVWSRRPVLSKVVRVGLVLAPIVVGWLAVRFSQDYYWRPDGWPGFVAWLLQAVAVAAVATHLVSKVADVVAPLTALLNMTLVFPDQAPSRFGTALRSGTVKKLTRKDLILSDDAQVAAEQAVELVARLATHDRGTRGHTERVRAYAELIGEEMGLDEVEMNKLRWGVLLHDIGKLAVPEEILNKDGRPTDDEWRILKVHPAAGGKIVAPLRPWLGEWTLAASQHHERWDGTGYPGRLAGLEISLAGRITAVADAFDVITATRSYKKALSPEAARRELVDCAGTQFDPTVVRAFLRVGLHRRKSAGFLSWLLETPTIGNALGNVAATPAAAVSAAAVSVAAVAGVAGITIEEPPATLAFEEPAVVEVAPASSTPSLPPTLPPPTTAPPSTTAAAAPSTTAAPTTTTTAAAAPTTTTTAAAAPTTTTTAAAAPSTTTTAAPTTTTTAAPTTTTEPPTAPVGADDFVTATTHEQTFIYVLDNDDAGGSTWDLSTLQVVDDPERAQTWGVQTPDYRLKYKSFNGYTGPDAMTYKVCTVAGLCTSATVWITVVP